MAITVRENNLYANGYTFEKTQGREFLKRDKIEYSPSAENDRSYRVIETDTIWSIAYRYYGDSKWWHVIADVNSIENPMDLSVLVGTELIIPDLERIKISRV